MSDREAPRRKTYGRQLGRPLSARQKALLAEALPPLAIRLPADGETLRPAALFAPGLERDAPLWLEVGFGAGEHLAWQIEEQARRGNAVRFIAGEFFQNGIVKLLGRLDRALAQQRLRIYQGDAGRLLAALPDRCLDRVFILFPDPWPKRRHHKRRFVGDETLDQLARVMKPGAELRLATDDPGYLSWCLACLTRHPDFYWTARRPSDWRQRPPDWPQTRYESKALEAGRRPSFLRYRRRESAPSDGLGPASEKPCGQRGRGVNSGPTT